MTTITINNKIFYPYIDTHSSKIYLNNNVVVDQFTDADLEFINKGIPSITGKMLLYFEKKVTPIDCTFFNCQVLSQTDDQVILLFQAWTNETMVKQESSTANINA